MKDVWKKSPFLKLVLSKDGMKFKKKRVYLFYNQKYLELSQHLFLSGITEKYWWW